MIFFPAAPLFFGFFALVPASLRVLDCFLKTGTGDLSDPFSQLKTTGHGMNSFR